MKIIIFSNIFLNIKTYSELSIDNDKIYCIVLCIALYNLSCALINELSYNTLLLAAIVNSIPLLNNDLNDVPDLTS